MCKIGMMLWEKIIAHKLLIFSFLLIGSFVYIMRDDYIVADAYIKPSDDYVAVTQDHPMELKIYPSSSNIYSVLFSIQNPEIALEASTEVGLYEGNELIASAILSHNEYYEMTDSLGNATELLQMGGGKG